MNPLLAALRRDLSRLPLQVQPAITGQVLRYDGLVVEATGIPVSPGTLCRIETDTGPEAEAEVVGFAHGRTLLFLDQSKAAILPGARLRVVPGGQEAEVGPGLLGRVIDAKGAPLDDLGPVAAREGWPLNGVEMNPLARTAVERPLDVGIRIVNAALALGQGQRVGIVAGSGVGKSVLMQMMARYTKAEVVVIGLIGERAREVGDFVRTLMVGEAARRICVIAVPADRSPLLRLRGARRATAVAEYFRAQGKQVLLMIDSLTRVAHAQREVGLALGEPPTAKGYPPSVVSLIPALIERAGPGLPGQGAITAIYTVLADGDDTTNDPVVDTARAILDGHLVLSRRQTQMGLYPAVDVPQSVSRVMNDIVDPDHRRAATRLRQLIATWMENRELMLMGGYAAGQDADLDAAVRLWPRIRAFISQQIEEPSDFAASRAALLDLVAEAA